MPEVAHCLSQGDPSHEHRPGTFPLRLSECAGAQIHIPQIEYTELGCSAARVQQRKHECPVPITCEGPTPASGEHGAKVIQAQGFKGFQGCPRRRDPCDGVAPASWLGLSFPPP